MSSNLKTCLSQLEFIASIKDSKLRGKILDHIRKNKNIYKALREIAVNTVNGKIKLKPKDKLKLRSYKSAIIKLTKKKNSSASRRKLIIQSGGFLPVLIPLVTAILSEVINAAR